MKIFFITSAIVAGLYVAGLIYLVLCVAGFTNYWKNQIGKAAPKNALVYVALGDSAAQGLGAYTPRGGYVGQFAKRLEATYNRPVQIINLSKSGARIQDVIKDQLPLLKKYKGDVITLDIGGNDIARFDANEFKTGYSDLVNKLPAETVISDVPYFGGRTQLPFFGSGKAEQAVLIANKIITDITKNKNLRVVPLHDVSKTRNGSWIWFYAPDYFHPNNLGYRAWTDAFWDAYSKK